MSQCSVCSHVCEFSFIFALRPPSKRLKMIENLKRYNKNDLSDVHRCPIIFDRSYLVGGRPNPIQIFVFVRFYHPRVTDNHTINLGLKKIYALWVVCLKIVSVRWIRCSKKVGRLNRNEKVSVSKQVPNKTGRVYGRDFSRSSSRMKLV